jgi:ubiquitin-like protein ATG12
MESVFLYVNSSFAPALDEVVGNLHRVSSCSFLGGKGK